MTQALYANINNKKKKKKKKEAVLNFPLHSPDLPPHVAMRLEGHLPHWTAKRDLQRRLLSSQ
jgi:hypothetical protein